MGRVQLALNVEDLDAAIDFYTRLFRTGPAKVRDGYANFAIDDPPLKLVLVSGYGTPGSLNHLGVEVPTSDEVQAAKQRLRDEGLETTVEDETECCYATQDKVWVSDPAGAWWEVYTVLGDSDVFNPRDADAEPSTSRS
jgi:catechol 2,3-dioxygenase-like lactoylglutathione lyase family enzyme